MSELGTTRDDRRPAYGLGRLVIAVHALASLWLVVRVLALVLGTSRTTAGEGGDLLVAALYGVSAAGVLHNGHRMRAVAWVGSAVCLLGVLLGALLDGGAAGAAVPALWQSLGARFAFLPLVVPVVGLTWLGWSRPGRGA